MTGEIALTDSSRAARCIPVGDFPFPRPDYAKALAAGATCHCGGPPWWVRGEVVKCLRCATWCRCSDRRTSPGESQ